MSNLISVLAQAKALSEQEQHRGKQVKKRGISKEQVCVGTALDIQGNMIIELLCTGSVTANELERLYST